MPFKTENTFLYLKTINLYLVQCTHFRHMIKNKLLISEHKSFKEPLTVEIGPVRGFLSLIFFINTKPFVSLTIQHTMYSGNDNEINRFCQTKQYTFMKYLTTNFIRK